jgi:fatty-acid desaturase
MSDHSSRLNWVTAGAFAVFHTGALAALFLFTWQAFWVALALLWITGGWGIGIGYHRLLTHRGYETPLPRAVARLHVASVDLVTRGRPRGLNNRAPATPFNRPWP